MVVVLLIAYVAYVAPTLGRPLLERHAFRQTQTAYPARVYHEEGIDLLHPKLPVLGEPFEIPFEFPLFQAAAALVMGAGVAEDRALRTTGLACFLLTALLLFGLVRHVAGPVSGVVAIAAFVLTPFALLWGRTSMIEYLATAGGVGFAWAAIVWRERGRPLPFALALAAGLVGLLVKPTTAVFWLLPPLAYRPPTALDAGKARRVRIGTAAMVGAPLVAAFLWTRHADAVKAASATTSWLTSGELRRWGFGTLEQRLDPATWQAMLSPVAVTLVGAGGVVLLAVAVVATVMSAQKRFWAAIWLAAVGPVLVFTNLYVVHDYYLAAVTPALAALIGLGAGHAWSHVPSTPIFAVFGVAAVLALVGTTLEFGRDYGSAQVHESANPTARELAQQVQRHTGPDDKVVAIELDWSPVVLYYARRRGVMITPPVEDAGFDLAHARGYGFLLAPALDSSYLHALDRWAYLGAVDHSLYTLGDRAGDMDTSAFMTTRVMPGSRLRRLDVSVPCGEEASVPAGAAGTWLRLAPAAPGDRIVVSRAPASLPVRRYVWIGPELAVDGRIALSCTGTTALTLEAWGAGPAD